MEQTGQTPSVFLSNYKTRQRKYLDLEDFAEATGNQYTHTVMTVWTISFERLKERNPLAIVLLRALAFVHPDSIPVKLIKIALAPELSEHGLQPDDLNDLIVNLRSFSLIRQSLKSDCDESDPSKHTISIHRLVQATILLGMENNDKMKWCQKIISALDEEVGSELDVYAPLRKKKMDAYTPHIRHMFTEFSPSPSKEITSLLSKATSYFLRHAAYEGTENLAKLAVSNSEIVNGPMHPPRRRR